MALAPAPIATETLWDADATASLDAALQSMIQCLQYTFAGIRLRLMKIKLIEVSESLRRKIVAPGLRHGEAFSLLLTAMRFRLPAGSEDPTSICTVAQREARYR